MRPSPGTAARGPARALPVLALLSGAGGLALGTAGMLEGREPFATWYYPFAWFSTLLAADAVVALKTGEFRLLGRPAHTLTLLAWSAALWLVFELANLRLRNWYYVFVPEDAAARRAGVLMSFATVLPAVFVAEALLRSLGFAASARCRRVAVTPRLRRGLAGCGALLACLPLLWPRAFFPLVWVGPTLTLDALVHRRDPLRSLLGDLERGRPGRPLRVLAGGAAVGLLWELFNARARGKWIYTVPGFEELKLFEMPVAGFLGFPPFALECFAAWQALVLAGLAVPRHGPPLPASGGRRLLAALAAAAISTAALVGMERSTVASTTPTLEDVPGAPVAALRRLGIDVWDLAETPPAGLASDLGLDPAAARGWVERARLVTLRGIGGEGARALARAGVESVAGLAAAEPERLAVGLRAVGAPVPAARVRVWVRAARDAVRGRPTARAALGAGAGPSVTLPP